VGVLGGEPEGELVQAGSAHDDCAGPFQPPDAWGRLDGPMAVEARPGRRHVAGMIDEVLESHWHSSQFARIFP